MPSSKRKLTEGLGFFAFIVSHNYSLVNKIGYCHVGRLSLSRQNIKVADLALTSCDDFTTFPSLKAAVLYNLS